MDAPHELPFIYQPSTVTESHQNHTSPPSSLLQQSPPPPPSEHCRKKFAWFVAPDFRGKSESESDNPDREWKMGDGPFDPLQYQQQTAGFEESLAYIKTVYAQEGPFDGLLGFSQGAAMAAALVCGQQTRRRLLQTGEMEFGFVILCSGFGLMKLMEVEEEKIQMLKCPSLHIFGSDHGKDRQIANQASRKLASLFDEGCSVTIEHDSGHIIPTRPPYIDQVKDFLGRFL